MTVDYVEITRCAFQIDQVWTYIVLRQTSQFNATPYYNVMHLLLSLLKNEYTI
jgi:hypothetical protein